MDEMQSIQGLIDQYYDKVVEFHKWYKNRQYEIYKSQFDHVKNLNSEIQSKGISIAYEYFEKQKSFTQANLEYVFF